MQLPEPEERHKYHLMARMPNEPGALERAAEIEHCLICGGHGAVSVLNELNNTLEVHGTVQRYRAES